MAKQIGPLKIQGKLDNLSFYHSVYGPIVRRKGGPSKKQIKTKKSCEPVRRNNDEFREAKAISKLLYGSIIMLRRQMYDHSLRYRLIGLVLNLKNLDATSDWGLRTVAKGMMTKTGLQLIEKFEFNENMPLKTLLKSDYSIDTKDRFVINDFVPARDLKYPKGASHVMMKSVLLYFDPAAKKVRLTESNVVTFEINRKKSDVLLAPNKEKLNTGIKIHLLQICFVNERDAKLLGDKITYNGLGIVKVSV